MRFRFTGTRKDRGSAGKAGGREMSQCLMGINVKIMTMRTGIGSGGERERRKEKQQNWEFE